jgi:toxin HigB-1
MARGMSIRSIRHRGLRGLYDAGEAKSVPASLLPKIRDMLLAIDEATEVHEVALFPGWKLHPLKGDLKGFWSLTVTGNLRIVFRFEKGGAFEVDLIDYH